MAVNHPHSLNFIEENKKTERRECNECNFRSEIYKGEVIVGSFSLPLHFTESHGSD